MGIKKIARACCGGARGTACGVLTHPAGSLFPRQVRPTLNVTSLLQVTPAVLLQLAGGTRSTFTSCGPYPPYTFTSYGLHPPYCCFVPVTPVALSCPIAADTSSKLLPLAGCAANLNTAVYDFMTNSWYLRRTSMRTVHGRSSIRIHSSDASFEPCHFESSIMNF